MTHAPISTPAPLARFAALARTLEAASHALGELNQALKGHPLAPAWAWRVRLEAVRRQSSVDGRAIDPWHLAALTEGVRFRMDGSLSVVDRADIFANAHHAFGLYRWYTRPDCESAPHHDPLNMFLISSLSCRSASGPLAE